MDWVTVIGLLAAGGTTIAFLPQVLKILKTKQTRDISLPTYALFTAGIFLWLAYGLLITDIPIIIANSITFVTALAILILKIRHG